MAVAADTLARGVVPLRRSMRRHRAAWIAAGGFLTGIALSALPKSAWAKTGAVAATLAAAIARSMLTPMIAGAIMARQHAPADDVVDAPAGEDVQLPPD